MKEKRLSVVVPVYNVEDYLETSVNSILAQSYPNMELILVDDGSTDHSGAICDELAEKHPNIAVIHQPNGGVSSAKKLRFAVLELLTSAHMPRGLVSKIGQMNSYRIKGKWGLQRLMAL